ncbi:MAG: beta-N-acetylhexosaminidase [Acidobacteriota bacterium]|nr:beta-N-acetylhexosaminidase [Acidobacteriota bacterium]
MDLDAKIGQLFVVPAPRPDLIHHVRDNQVGGVIWFQTTTAEAAAVNAHLQTLAHVPLLISADLEAGMGMRFTDAEWWLPAMALAATGDPAFAEEQARATAREARAIGINHILAPVADVNVDPLNPVINTRSFGEDPHAVASYVTAFVRGLEDEGVLACAKHFPGHGDTHVDSHRSLPVLDVTRERLDAIELVPFRAAIAAGVSSIMIGHLSVPAIDPTPAPVRGNFENVYGTTHGEVPRHATMPATLSKPVIDILRRDLGFQGLVITDAMDMGGLAAHFDAGEAAVRAIEAGEDQILFSVDTDAAIAAVREAVRSGRISRARIDESVERILRAKRGLVEDRQSCLSGSRKEHPDRIADGAVKIVRDTNNLLPLRAKKIAVVIVNPHHDAMNLGLESNADRDDAEVLVLALVIRPKSGAGTISVPEEIQRLAQRHAQKTIAISFGSPYIVRELGDVSTFICAWGPQPVMQRAALRVLRGK